MNRMAFKTLLAALLLVVLVVSPSAAQDLGVIAPGLTGSTLCPLIKSNPQAAIDAVATGAAAAYDQGPQAINNYAQAMGAAVGAASANGCVGELFEGVNQAIIKGGFKVEYVTGKALALGVAQGTASDGGQILAKATAVVVCRGGASAQACARAWNQAVKFDPVNGCAVLVQAFVQARARCAAGKAITEVKAQVWRTPLGFCRAPASVSGTDGNGQGGLSGQNTVQISQGAGGQTVTGLFPGILVYQSSAGQQVNFGRKMMAAPNCIAVVNAKKSQFRKLLQYSYWPYDNSDTTSNSASTAVNNGIANGGVFANSASNARGRGYGYGYGSGWGRTTANSAATAVNKGIANGPVVANSFANADGGRKLMASVSAQVPTLQ